MGFAQSMLRQRFVWKIWIIIVEKLFNLAYLLRF
jgi:hypothetical protein